MIRRLIKVTLIIILTSGYLNVGPGVSSAETVQDELTLALNHEAIKGFDPIMYDSSNGVPLIQSTLLSFDKDMDITYDLADEYQISEDKLTWEFKIRDDAYFTNGEPVKASDVAFTFNSAKYKGLSDLSFLKEAVVIDDYTVHFRLERPLSTFNYTAAQLGIVPAKHYDESYPGNPIGSGPYILEKWEKGKQAVFRRNEHYYGDKPFFKKITVLLMDEDKAYAAAQEGLVDIAQTSYAYANVGVDGMVVNSYKGNDQYGISFITVPSGSKVNGKLAGNDVTSELSIRQAINLAVSRNEIIHEVLFGYGTEAYHNADQLPWGYKDMDKEYHNIDKAKEILQLAGWTDTDEDGVLEKQGLKAKFNLQFLESDSISQSIARILKQQLDELGIEVELIGRSQEELEANRYRDPLLIRTGNDTPLDMYYEYHSDNIGLDVYHTNLYFSEETDRLVEEALVSGDFEAWQLVQKNAAENVPWTWLITPEHLFFTRKGLMLGDAAFQSYEQPMFILKNIAEWQWKE